MSVLTKKQDDAPTNSAKRFTTSKKALKEAGINYSAPPQVNLLPVEIVEKRNLKALQIRMGVYLLGLVLVLGLGYAAVKVEQVVAQNRYDKAIEETARLKAEELKYAEVPLVLNQIDKSETALRDGMYREILWNQYLGAIAATVPDDGIITSLAVTAATPNEAGPGIVDELQSDSIGQLTFTANLLTVPDASAWLAELNSIPGFQDPRLSTATYEDVDGTVTYNVEANVRITEEAYSGRFEPQEDNEVDE
ncbi:DUF4006 family protein [Populibacterium corticicola]|uniref:DUF4006 family protein n=1 Tax=Populibacterium corticicola TaxID=1812826 RepID=A0ABW5XB27_9MICO